MAHTRHRTESPESKELRKKAGEYIRKLRLNKGLTQLDLAKALGLDYYSFISQVENGGPRVPPQDYHTWAKALGVDVKDFVTTLLRFYDPFTFDALFGGDRGRRKAARE